MRVEPVAGDRPEFMPFLREDPVRNAFALYDLEEEGDRVQCFAAVEGDAFRGYLLAWHGRQFPNVIVTGDKEAAETLLPRAPPSPVPSSYSQAWWRWWRRDARPARGE